MKKTMVLLCSLLFVTACSRAQTADTTFFEGARLIVGDGSAPIENSAFIVDHGRFTKIGKKGVVQAPAGTVRVDLTGKTVMPAMVDTHSHLPTGNRENLIDQLKIRAYVGIAAITDMGGGGAAGFAVRAEQPPDCAQVVMSGPGMTGPLGTVPLNIKLGDKGRLPEDQRSGTKQVTDPQVGIDTVRLAAKEGAEFIKIWVNDRGGLEVPMKPAVYQAIIAEAHRHHLFVLVDEQALDVAKDLVRAGVDGFAHPIRVGEVDDEFMQLLKDRPNVFMETNLVELQLTTIGTAEPTWLKDPLMLDIATPEWMKTFATPEARTKTFETYKIHDGWPGQKISLEDARNKFALAIRNTQKLYKAGVRYAVGPDGGASGPPGGFNFHAELEVLVKDVGLTPSQVITMATRDGARALRLDSYLGTVESGKDASFIVLNANPLDDITNTRRIARVYLRGNQIDRAGIKADWKRKHPL